MAPPDAILDASKQLDGTLRSLAGQWNAEVARVTAEMAAAAENQIPGADQPMSMNF